MRRFAFMFALFAATGAHAAAPTSAQQALEGASFFQQFNQEMASFGGKAKLTAHESGVVMKSIYCVVQKAGLKPVMALYRDIRTVQTQAQALCKAGKEEEAKTFVLNQYIPRQQDPTVLATIACFEEHQTEIAGIIRDPKKAARLPSYARWAKSPELARSEMKAQELCH